MAAGDPGFTSTLTIGANKFDVLDFSTSFYRSYDQKGRPSSAVGGGNMSMTIEITEEGNLIETMINAQNTSIEEGKLEFWQSGKDGVFRTVTFKNAYIAGYGENFQSTGGTNFIANISITAEKIDIGVAKYDAGWPINS